MISAERFVILLEEKDLLPADMLAALRKQIARSAAPIPVSAIIEDLIDQGYLTPVLAERLLSTDEKAPPSESDAHPPALGDEEELELVPREGESVPAAPKGVPTIEPSQETAEETTKGSMEPQRSVSEPRTVKPTPQITKPAARSLLDEELPGMPTMRRLGDLMSDAFLDDAAMADGAPLASRGPTRGLLRFFSRQPKMGPEKKAEDWGSPLMLAGGGGLLLLVILGVALAWSLAGRNADEMLQSATDDYRAGSYAQAARKYEAYLDRFPNHSGASAARVWIGLAKMRQVTHDNANWPLALQTADKVLRGIAAEPDFGAAHGELAGMLPAIAAGLAADAQNRLDPDRVDQTRQALALVDKYVPKSLRPNSKLVDVEDALNQTVHEISRGNELDKTVAAMMKQAKEARTREAYEACKALLRRYPELAEDGKLKEAVLATAAAQKALVRIVPAPALPELSTPSTATLSRVTLVHRGLAGAVAEGQGRIVFAAVDGAAYGLDASTGAVLWRRFVGFDANPQAPASPPMPLSSEPKGDVLLVDTTHNELLRVEGPTGRLLWRYPVGEPFSVCPPAAGDRIWVAAQGGKLIAISAKTGDASHYVQLPQALRVPPVVDARRSLVFQVADHDNLFVLSSNDGACKQVVPLGHQAGGATTAPALAGDYLFLALNEHARDGMLHVLAIQPDKLGKSDPIITVVQNVGLPGRVQTSPLVDGRKVLVVTDHGAHVFEISGADPKAPLHNVAETRFADGENHIHFALLEGERIWIGDSQLTQYDVQAANGRLALKWAVDERSVFLQPPVAVANAVIAVRRKPGFGTIVAAVGLGNGDRLWETRLGVPLARELVALDDGKTALAVRSDGAIFQVDDRVSGSRIDDRPLASVDAAQLREPIQYVAILPNGVLTITAGRGTDRIGVFDAGREPSQIRWLRAPGRLACSPISFAGGLLVPDLDGRVFLLNLDGDQIAEPFQARREPGVEFAWHTPLAADRSEVVVADGATQLYRLEVSRQPRPHLNALAQATISEAIVSPIAVVGETVYAVDAGGVLAAFRLPALTRGKGVAISGRCVFGPVQMTDRVLLATDADQLVCVDEEGASSWQVSMPYGPLAGAPVATGSHYLLASRSGVIWRLDAANGKELGKLDVGFPLGTGPVLLGRSLWVGGHDGTLYEVRQP